MGVSFRGMVVFVDNSTLARSPRVRNYGMSEIVWFPVSSWAVVTVGECTRFFFFFFIYSNNNNNNDTIYTYTTTLNLLGFVGIMGSALCELSRYTLKRYKVKSRLGQLSVTSTEPSAPDLSSSTGQALEIRQNQATACHSDGA